MLGWAAGADVSLSQGGGGASTCAARPAAATAREGLLLFGLATDPPIDDF